MTRPGGRSLAAALALVAGLAFGVPAARAWPLLGAARPATEATGALAARPRANLAAFARLMAYVRWFHPSDQALALDWDAFAIAGVRAVAGAPDAWALATALRGQFAQVAPAVEVFPAGRGGAWRPPAPPAGPGPLVAAWLHTGLGQRTTAVFSATRRLAPLEAGRPPADAPGPADVHEALLGGGVACRVPLGLWADARGTWPLVERPPALPARPAAVDGRAARLAATAIAWGALQHFHPRLSRDAWGWQAALEDALAEAAEDAAWPGSLRRLLARAHDGQARVAVAGAASRTAPAVSLGWVDGRVVVLAAAAGSAVRPGDALLAVDGRPATTALAAAIAEAPGATADRRRWVALRGLLLGPPGEPVALRVAREGAAPFTAALMRPRAGGAPGAGPRPGASATPRSAPIAIMGPGAWYVDLTRAEARAWRQVAGQLSRARAIVFDLRGESHGRVAAAALAAVAREPLRAPRFYVPRPRRPDDARPPRSYHGFSARPTGPRLAARLAFLADARTIGDAEAVLAMAAWHRLGPIVGAPSAGTIGPVEALALPARARIAWTGVDVRWPDDTPFTGVRPDVAVAPTPEGVRAGLDEALERALALVATETTQR